MTREEIINEGRPDEPYCFESDKEEQWYKIGLYEGATANPWISINEQLPQVGTLVLWKSYRDMLVAYRDEHNCINYQGGYFGTIHSLELDYWMPIPELPEEKK